MIYFGYYLTVGENEQEGLTRPDDEIPINTDFIMHHGDLSQN